VDFVIRYKGRVTAIEVTATARVLAAPTEE